jgi:hypothetical protein
MKDDERIEGLLGELTPPEPRPEIEAEIMARVGEGLHPFRWSVVAAAAVLILVFASVHAYREEALRQRVAILTHRACAPGAHRAVSKVSPFFREPTLAARLRAFSRRPSDSAWVRHLMRLHAGGSDHG